MYRGGPFTSDTHIPVFHTHLSFMSGLAPHDQDSATQLVMSAGTTALPTPSCKLMTSEWTRIGTDTITAHGHPAFDAQNSRGWPASCDPAPLTTSFGTVGQWERRHRATAPTTRHNATCLCPDGTDTASLPPVLQPSRQLPVEVSFWNSTSLGGTSSLSSRWVGCSRRSSEVDWTMQRDGLPTRSKFSVVIAKFYTIFSCEWSQIDLFPEPRSVSPASSTLDNSCFHLEDFFSSGHGVPSGV